MGADVAGIVVVAEVGGLVGAWRQRAPDAAGGSSFEPGAVRDWLTFTAEPALGGTAALVAGIVARAGRPTATPAALMAQLRPLHPAASLVGHLHAAAFTYRHVPRRTATVASVVGGLLRDETPRGVLHLLYDARVESALARQSTLVRGLAWAAPVRSVEVEP